MNQPIRRSSTLDWSLRLVAALILALAVPPKLTAAPDAVAMFTQLGAGSSGRIATAVFESIAVVLLIAPSTVVFGALLAAGLMTGALCAHFAVLGIAPGGDPSMFLMALAAFACAVALAWRRRRQIPLVAQFLRSSDLPAS